MNSIKAVIFFALIVTANSLISDYIYNVTKTECKESISLLKPLKVYLCKTTGDRGLEDLLCNGIASTLTDICSESSSIKIGQVMNASKLNDSLEGFCNKTASVKIDNNLLPNNVSESLAKMSKTTSCSWFCSVEETGLNPMCAFLVSFAEFKHNVNSKKTVLRKDSVLIHANNTVKKDDNSASYPFPNTNQNNESNTVVDEHSDQRTPTENKKTPTANKVKPVTHNLNQGGENFPSDNANDSRNEGANAQLQPDINQNDKIIEQNKKIDEGGVESDIALNKSRVDQTNTKLNSEDSRLISEPFAEAEGGHFFTYFVFISALCMFFYVAMYNKKKILALLIEGRRTNVKRRPNSAAYSKLDCTLEEAMASGPSTSTSNTLLY